MKNGWVKLHRTIADNPMYFSEPFTKYQAWMDLVLFSNHKDGVFYVRGNAVKVKRGQIGWSQLKMAHRWGWSRNKVKRFLDVLETEQQIVFAKVYKITTLITIINYEKYQSDTTEGQQTIQPKGNRRSTNKNVKNDKKVEGRFTPPTITEVKEYCEERKNGINPKKFISSYEAKGWMIGNSKVKDWKACVRTWEQSPYKEPTKKVGGYSVA